MKQFAIFAASVVCTLANQSAFAAEETLSGTDSAAIDGLIDPVLAGLKGPDFRDGVNGYLATMKTGSLSPAQINNVLSQIDNGLQLYGPVDHCNQFDEQVKGQMIVQRKYVCQHPKFVTRWTFLVVKLPDGWSAGSIYFDDSISEVF